MSTPAILAGTFWFIASLLHIASMAIVAVRLRRTHWPLPRRANTGLVSIVRPVCGVEPSTEQSLRSGFLLNDGRYELIFCAHAVTDPAIPLVRKLMAEHALVPSRLLIGDGPISGNPKLDNVAKSWPELQGEWLLLCDSNIILPPDFMDRHFFAWRERTGVVSSTHIGACPEGFWAEVECAFLNVFQARWHIAAAAAGSGFAHGKTMLLRRRDLEEMGGFEALGRELGEDVAVTKFTYARGRTVDTLPAPVVQPIGRRSAVHIFRRQARWARLRRHSYPLAFMPEVLAGGLTPAFAAAVVASAFGTPWLAAVFAQLLFWYGAELLFSSLVGWHMSWRALPASVVRDAMIPLVWMSGWLGREFRWGDKIVYGTVPQAATRDASTKAGT